MWKFFIVIPVLVLALSGCLTATPFQSARVAENGEANVTTSILHSSVDAGNRSGGWNQLDLTVRNAMVGGKAEASFGVGLMVFSSQSFGGTLGVGMKFELLEDILSLEIPARFLLGGSNPLDTTHFYPRLIASLPLSEVTELNVSATRYYYSGGSVGHIPVGYSVGLALGKRGEVIIRPEFGILINYDSEPTFQVGIGFTPAVEKGAANVHLDPVQEMR